MSSSSKKALKVKKPQLKNHLSKEECLKRLAAETFERVTLSFYRYVELVNPEELRDELYREWSELGVFGRVYLAREGVNGQVSVPEQNLEAFRAALDARPAFAHLRLNIAIEDKAESFYKLTLKVKKQIVADGLLEGTYDLSQVGNHLSAAEFNAALDDERAVVVDMRNFYESRIGRFDKAICPDSNTFKEELPMVLQMLKGKEDQKLLMYCTGGIRCEKASAYLRSQGFKDVNQLNGGIIHYLHEVEREALDNRFHGKNFVFDERIAEKVSDEILTTCDQCEAACDAYTNCANAACNLLFIQCPVCAERMQGACTADCQRIVAMSEEERLAYYAAQPACTQEIYISRIRPQLK